MVLSYKWLSDYLPVELPHEKLSMILNAIGLEVESYEAYEEVPGGLAGLVIGKVLEVSQHPNADRLKVTRVDLGTGTPFQIVCGAPNVAQGQTVLVAPVGATIHPKGHPSMTMRLAKIRGIESHGMICAEDEVGLGDSHDGIMILPDTLTAGMPAAEHFCPYSDHVIEIGLTPNRSDAMSHLGVARDVCAWLRHHEGLTADVRLPFDNPLPTGDESLPFEVRIEAPDRCLRYAGVTISGVSVEPSPRWLQDRLRAIGVRPINNIVDITNYVLHETGQPLHAFDADRIAGRSIRVKTLEEGTPFKGLDGKERNLSAEDLMICDGNGQGLCIGGVFGGIESGVTDHTQNIFLESAWFHPVSIRKTSFRHQLRTDAATHFEKGVDIGRTADVLRRAADMICRLLNGRIASGVIDAYPDPAPQRTLTFSCNFIRRLSGKAYGDDTIAGILSALGFTIRSMEGDQMTVIIPSHKTDISLPADIAEEVMRIDGFDNIAIPTRISYSPTPDPLENRESAREKISGILAGIGFQEMLNNSITFSGHYTAEALASSVRMMNSLSAELDMMRPSMLETGLQAVSHNLNRKNLDLQLFEFGKTYARKGDGDYVETDRLAMFQTGLRRAEGWKKDGAAGDLFHLKGVVELIFRQTGIEAPQWVEESSDRLEMHLSGLARGSAMASIGKVRSEGLSRFDIRQDVWYAEINWGLLMDSAGSGPRLRYREVPRFPAVTRDLAFVVDRHLPYERIRFATEGLKLNRLRSFKLFDIFESEKLGAGLKSMAMSFTFLDEEKTLTDTEVDDMVQKIVTTFEKDLGAQVRR
jgi:phenylalanyl-tRNA synthetase beta chain